MVQPWFILFEHIITYSDEAAHPPELYRLTWLGKRAGGYGDDQHCWALSSPGSDRLLICVCSMGIAAKSPEVFLSKSQKFQRNIWTLQGNIWTDISLYHNMKFHLLSKALWVMIIMDGRTSNMTRRVKTSYNFVFIVDRHVLLLPSGRSHALSGLPKTWIGCFRCTQLRHHKTS
jgi:hypothetical protein